MAGTAVLKSGLQVSNLTFDQKLCSGPTKQPIKTPRSVTLILRKLKEFGVMSLATIPVESLKTPWHPDA